VRGNVHRAHFLVILENDSVGGSECSVEASRQNVPAKLVEEVQFTSASHSRAETHRWTVDACKGELSVEEHCSGTLCENYNSLTSSQHQRFFRVVEKNSLFRAVEETAFNRLQKARHPGIELLSKQEFHKIE